MNRMRRRSRRPRFRPVLPALRLAAWISAFGFCAAPFSVVRAQSPADESADSAAGALASARSARPRGGVILPAPAQRHADGSTWTTLAPPAEPEPARFRSPGVLSESSRPAPRPYRALPWVEALDYSPPLESDLSADPARTLPHRSGGAEGFERLSLPPWELFRHDARLDAPTDLDVLPHLPLFYVPPPRKSGVAKAVEFVLEKKMYSEVRRFVKRQWRNEFIATPTMSYATYLDGVTQINRLGRDPFYDDGNSQHFANQVRDDVFGRVGREGERDFEIFALGPIVVMDSGSVRFDIGRAMDLDPSEPVVPDAAKVVDPESPRSKPILCNRSYRVGTSVRLGFDPGKAWDSADPSWIIDRYGLVVEVGWLSDVLGRETMATEFEFQVERTGDFATFVNLVFRSR